MPTSTYSVRPARTSDVRAIQAIREPFLGKVLQHHELVGLFEKIQEFSVVVDENDRVLAAGALHVMWQDLAEVLEVFERVDRCANLYRDVSVAVVDCACRNYKTVRLQGRNN